MLAVADNLVRILNFVFLVICLAFASSLINTRVRHSSRVNFCLFTAAYGIATDSLYGIFANFIEPLAWPLILLCLDFLNFVFTFSAGTALAVGIRAHSCNNHRYLNDNTSIIQGSETRCRQAQALVAFLYFSMGVFLAKLVLSTLKLVANGPFNSGGMRFGGSSRRSRSQVGVPTVSQV